jgi:hypothetical protein
MSGARRRARREAKQAVKQLMKQGMPARAIGAVASTEKLKFTLMKIVNKLDRKLETGEGDISVREGIAAISEIRRLEQAQGKLVVQAAEEELNAPIEPEPELPPHSEPAASEAGLTPQAAEAAQAGSAANPPMKAAS